MESVQNDNISKIERLTRRSRQKPNSDCRNLGNITNPIQQMGEGSTGNPIASLYYTSKVLPGVP